MQIYKYRWIAYLVEEVESPGLTDKIFQYNYQIIKRVVVNLWKYSHRNETLFEFFLFFFLYNYNQGANGYHYL